MGQNWLTKRWSSSHNKSGSNYRWLGKMVNYETLYSDKYFNKRTDGSVERRIHKHSHRHAPHLQIWKDIQLRRPIKNRVFVLFCQYRITGKKQSVREWVGCECGIFQVTQICVSVLTRRLLPFNKANLISTFNRLQTLKWPKLQCSLSNCVITVKCTEVSPCLGYTCTALSRGVSVI